MSVMTFLKKAGLDFLKVGSVVTGLQPYFDEAGQIISAVKPSAAGTVSKIESELVQFNKQIVQVEAISAALSQPLPGPEKLQAAVPLIGQVVAGSALMVGKQIANPDLYNKAMQGFAQASADLANSLHPSTNTTNP